MRPLHPHHRGGSHRQLAPHACPPDRTRSPHLDSAASRPRSGSVSSAGSGSGRRHRRCPPSTQPTPRVGIPTDWDDTFPFENFPLPTAPGPTTVPSIAADIRATPTLAALAAQPPPLPPTHQQWLLAQQSSHATAAATASPATALQQDPRRGGRPDQLDTPAVTRADPASRSNTPTQVVQYPESDSDGAGSADRCGTPAGDGSGERGTDQSTAGRGGLSRRRAAESALVTLLPDPRDHAAGEDSGGRTAARRAHHTPRNTPSPRGPARTAPLTERPAPVPPPPPLDAHGTAHADGMQSVLLVCSGDVVPTAAEPALLAPPPPAQPPPQRPAHRGATPDTEPPPGGIQDADEAEINMQLSIHPDMTIHIPYGHCEDVRLPDGAMEDLWGGRYHAVEPHVRGTLAAVPHYTPRRFRHMSDTYRHRYIERYDERQAVARQRAALATGGDRHEAARAQRQAWRAAHHDDGTFTDAEHRRQADIAIAAAEADDDAPTCVICMETATRDAPLVQPPCNCGVHWHRQCAEAHRASNLADDYLPCPGCRENCNVADDEERQDAQRCAICTEPAGPRTGPLVTMPCCAAATHISCLQAMTCRATNIDHPIAASATPHQTHGYGTLRITTCPFTHGRCGVDITAAVTDMERFTDAARQYGASWGPNHDTMFDEAGNPRPRHAAATWTRAGLRLPHARQHAEQWRGTADMVSQRQYVPHLARFADATADPRQENQRHVIFPRPSDVLQQDGTNSTLSWLYMPLIVEAAQDPRMAVFYPPTFDLEATERGPRHVVGAARWDSWVQPLRANMRARGITYDMIIRCVDTPYHIPARDQEDIIAGGAGLDPAQPWHYDMMQWINEQQQRHRQLRLLHLPTPAPPTPPPHQPQLHAPPAETAPRPTQADSRNRDEWQSINNIAEKAFEAAGVIDTYEEVPRRHRDAMHGVWVDILESYQRSAEAATDVDTDPDVQAALRWLIASTSILLGKPRRGGYKGRQEVAARFAKWQRGQYTALLDAWQRDARHARTRHRSRAAFQSQREQLRTAMVKRVHKGCVGAAVQRLESRGVADTSDAEVRRQLRAKHPTRLGDNQVPQPDPQQYPGGALNDGASRHTTVDAVASMAEQLRRLPSYKAPGPMGLRYEHLADLARGAATDPGDEVHRQLAAPTARQALCGLDRLQHDYINLTLPRWFYRVSGSLRLVALAKPPNPARPNAKPVRPIGIADALRRVFHRRVVAANTEAARAYFEPLQYCLSDAAAAKLVHRTRMTLESNSSFIAMHLDVENAYNAAVRRAIVEAVAAVPSLAHLQPLAATILAPKASLILDGEVWVDANGDPVCSEEGVVQGDPLSSLLFGILLHEPLRELHDALAPHGGCATAGADDVYAVGPMEQVLPAVERFGARLATLGLRLSIGNDIEPSKCEYIRTDEDTGDAAAAFLARRRDGDAANPRDPHRLHGFRPRRVEGFQCFGIPVGYRGYVQDFLRDKAGQVANTIERCTDLLAEDTQDLWCIIRASLSKKFEYWTSLCDPHEMQRSRAAQIVDDAVWDAVRIALHITDPVCAALTAGEGHDMDVVRARLRLPLKLGGLGIRDTADGGIAYLGALGQAVPLFSRMADGADAPHGLATHLRHAVGAEPERSDTPLGPLVGSDTPTGRAYAAAVADVKGLLEHEQTLIRRHGRGDALATLSTTAFDLPPGAFAAQGKGTQRLLTQQLEAHRALALDAVVAATRPLHDPVRLAWTHFDADTSPRVFDAIPHRAELALQKEAFAMTAQRYLGAPLSVYLEVEGQPHHGGPVSNRRTADRHGFSAGSVGNSYYTPRHDAVRDAVHRLLQWAGIPADAEARDRFTRFFPRESDTHTSRRGDATPLTSSPPRRPASQPQRQHTARRQQRHGEAALQGCRPDLCFRLNGKDILAEIKTIGAVQSHYPIQPHTGNGQPRSDPAHPEYQPPVAAQAAKCHAQYEEALRSAARRSSPGDSNEADRRAQAAIDHLRATYGRVHPCVAGAWGEVNQEFKDLLHTIVDHKVGTREAGGTDGARSVAWQHVRRHLAIAIARANADFLRRVLGQTGDATSRDEQQRLTSAQQEARDRLLHSSWELSEAYRTHYNYNHGNAFPLGPPRD